MEEVLKNKGEKYLKSKFSKTDLTKIIIGLLIVVIFPLAVLVVRLSAKEIIGKLDSVEKSNERLDNNVSTLEGTVNTRFDSLEFRVKKNYIENQRSHEGIYKTLEVMRSSQDENRQFQMDVLRDLYDLKSSDQGYEQPVNNSPLQSKYKENLEISNEIYQAIQLPDNEKKNSLSY